MNLTLGDWLLLTVQILVGLGVLYAAFFKSYFHEKGKNVATHEDIEEITEKVEAVRAGLQYSLQSRLNLREEEQAALVSCFSKYYAWYGSIVGLSIVGDGDNFTEHMVKIRSHIEHLQNEFDAASGHMDLFVTSLEIVTAKDQLKLKTLELAAHALKASFGFEKLSLELSYVKKSTAPSEVVRVSSDILSKQQESFSNFKKEQLALVAKLVPEIEHLKVLISTHIRTLANTNIAT